MDPIEYLKDLAYYKDWGPAIFDMLQISDCHDNGNTLNDEIEDAAIEIRNEGRIWLRSDSINTGGNFHSENVDNRRYRNRFIVRSEPSRTRESCLRTQSPCRVSYRRNCGKNTASCHCNCGTSNNHESQAELRDVLERSRHYRKKKKPVDPNFIDEFKVADKSELRKKQEVSPARPLFRPQLTVEDEWYQNSDGLWIKRQISPDPDDPFPIKHKELYPQRYPEDKFATTEYIPINRQRLFKKCL